MPSDHSTDYELLDAGDGRRLDRFGPVVVDRPAPAAGGGRILGREAWAAADGRFDRDGGWTWRAAPPSDWTVELDGLTFLLRPAEAGQVGLFPEHVAQWPWLARRAPGATILNLFASTGAATVALARSGANVAHVDASRTAVAWARLNAERNGFGAAPIRWLVDDAPTFVRRELRRGRHYEGLVLDPPTYGHGTGGRAWRLERDLPDLVSACAQLLVPDGFVLMTAHTASLRPERLGELLGDAIGRPVATGPLELRSRSGACLPLGSFARLPA